MTKKEIIEECKQRLGFETDYEMYSLCQHEKDFYNAIIEALEQQPSDDCVSRGQALLQLTGVNLSDKTTEELIGLFGRRIKSLPPVTPTIPKGATNGNMVEIIFGKDVYCTLIRMMYSSCCEKLKKWWNTPYKRGSEDGI